MNTQVSDRTSTVRGVALSVVVAGIVSAVLNTLVSVAAQGLGADATTFMGLQPALYVAFGIVGLLVAAVAWSLVRSRAAAPTRVLRVLVPVVVVASLVPDLLIGVAGFGWTGTVALMIMHLVVATAGVLALRRFLPLPR